MGDRPDRHLQTPTIFISSARSRRPRPGLLALRASCPNRPHLLATVQISQPLLSRLFLGGHLSCKNLRSVPSSLFLNMHAKMSILSAVLLQFGSAIEIIGAGRGTSGTTTLHQALCAMGIQSEHPCEKSRCNYPEGDKGLHLARERDCLAVIAKFRSLRKLAYKQSSVVLTASYAAEIRQLLWAWSNEKGPQASLAVHDVPVAWFMRDLTRLNPKAN